MTADIILTTLQNISEGLVVYPKVSTMLLGEGYEVVNSVTLCHCINCFLCCRLLRNIFGRNCPSWHQKTSSWPW